VGEDLLNHHRIFNAGNDLDVAAAAFADLDIDVGGGNLATSYRSAGIAVCEAVLAHRKGEHQRVLEVLSPVRHDLYLIGGSHAQRDVFYQLLIDSAHRLGRADLVAVYLNDVRRIGFENVDQRTLYCQMGNAA
jgi:hypothetical protein